MMCVIYHETLYISYTSDISEPVTIRCNDDYIFDNEIKRCVPECGRWTYTSHSQERVVTALAITGTILGIITSTLFLFSSGIKYKQM